eukprot:c4533_g1_i2.p1 GENE.c4533_g1_i2~~c4533_g1_i2.p1  ORF type:complete len:122 (-),score=16.50 c4533_g1_i2:225-590(-)
MIEETGWGEFEMLIKISFRDPTQRPIEFSHLLRLYGDAETPSTRSTPVTNEFYDEIVFPSLRDGPKDSEGSASFCAALTQYVAEVTQSKGWKEWKDQGMATVQMLESIFDHLFQRKKIFGF